MLRSRQSFQLVVVCLLGVLLGTAAADDKSGKQKRADELFEEGRALLAQGDQNAAAACEKFNEAIKLDPEAPGTMLNLGLCNELLQKYKTALYWFRKAQARAAETNLPDYEAAAKEHTVTLKRDKVATIRIAFAGSAPAGTKVKIDDEEIAPADYLAAEVDPGEHTLVAGAPGHKIFTQQFTIAPNERQGPTITIQLVEGDDSIVLDPGAGRRKAAIITAAGGGALLAGSLVVTLLARARYLDCVDKDTRELKPLDNSADCRKHAMTDQEAVDYANGKKDTAYFWGTGLFVAGAVAVGVASFLYFTAPDKERIDRTVFTPVVGPNEFGISLSGGF